MIKCYRKAWTIPDRVFDILARFEPEVELDVIHAIRSYSKFWDEWGNDEGFSYDFSSDFACAVFYAVFDELKAYNQQYFERCQVLSENARVGVVKRKQKEVKRKKQSRYYENHREAINSKRRAQYAGKTKNAEGNTKNAVEVKRKGSDESTQNKSEQALQRKSAIAHRIIGLNKLTSLHSESLLGKRECEGEGGSCPHEAVGNSNQTGSLSCSKAVATGCAAPVASKAVRGSKDKGSRAGSNEATGSPVAGSGKAVNELGRWSERGSPPEANSRNLLSAPHPVRDGEVLITKDWRIDLADSVFYEYRRMDPFLKRGVEEWLKQNKLGCSVEKRWICRQIVNFAKRQRKLETLMGVDDVCE